MNIRGRRDQTHSAVSLNVQIRDDCIDSFDDGDSFLKFCSRDQCIGSVGNDFLTASAQLAERIRQIEGAEERIFDLQS